MTDAEQNLSRGPARPTSVDDELAARIARHGSVGFDEFVDVALYHPDSGFFATGGGAGRSGADFLTSPEVGPLFGAVVARYLDARWTELGRPDPFVVVEAAAGRGALAIAVLAAGPECAPSLRYVLVERSERLRERQADHLPLVHPFEVLGPEADADLDRPAAQVVGPLVCSLSDLPAQRVDGVVIANELLDNVPFRLLERTERSWDEVAVTTSRPPDGSADGQADASATGSAIPATPASAGSATPSSSAFVELCAAADERAIELAGRLAPDAAAGSRIPLQDGAVDWLRRALEVLRSGSVLVIDYGATSAELAERSAQEWIRTYRKHERGTAPLDAPGSQDVTCEVAFDQLHRVAQADDDSTQTDWLRRWGIDELVEEGRRLWTERASAPDLVAMRGRSRVAEAEALTDPDGLGAFRVLEWRV